MYAALNNENLLRQLGLDVQTAELDTGTACVKMATIAPFVCGTEGD
jgi:hypothetical protein